MWPVLRVRASIDIHAPIEAVFAALTDPKRVPEWTDNVIEVHDISDYPVQEGTTWEQLTVVADRRLNLVCHVTAFEPPHGGVLEISGDHRGRISTRCEQVGDATRVTQDIEFEAPGGILGRVAGALIGPALKGELARAMERQREILEREAGEAEGPM